MLLTSSQWYKALKRSPQNLKKRRVIAQDSAPSEDPAPQGYSERVIRELKAELHEYKYMNAVLKIKVSDLEANIVDLQEKLDKAETQVLSSEHQDKIASYDNSVLGIPESAMSDLIDKY